MTEIWNLSDMIYKQTTTAETYEVSLQHFANKANNPYA